MVPVRPVVVNVPLYVQCPCCCELFTKSTVIVIAEPLCVTLSVSKMSRPLVPGHVATMPPRYLPVRFDARSEKREICLFTVTPPTLYVRLPELAELNETVMVPTVECVTEAEFHGAP